MTCGQTSALFDASLMVIIRKRLSKDAMDQLNEAVWKQAGVLPEGDQEVVKRSGDQCNGHGYDPGADDQGSTAGNDIQHHQPLTDSHAMPPDELAKPGEDKPQPQDTAPVSGTLLIDAIMADQQIEYPTDLKLLNESREQLKRIMHQNQVHSIKDWIVSIHVLLIKSDKIALFFFPDSHFIPYAILKPTVSPE